MADSLIIRGGRIIPGRDPSDTTMSDAAVGVENDTIRELDEWRIVKDKYPGAKILGSEKVAILPGLINAHHHSNGVSTIQQGMPDRLLESWLLAFACLRPTDTYLNTLLSSARLLRSGVTTVVDVHGASDTATGYDGTMRRALKAYDEAGMRVAFAAGIRTQSFIVHGKGQDQEFLKTLPDDLRATSTRLLPADDHEHLRGC